MSLSQEHYSIAHIKVIRRACRFLLPIAVPLQQPTPLVGRHGIPSSSVFMVQCSSALLDERKDEDEVGESGECEVGENPAVLSLAMAEGIDMLE